MPNVSLINRISSEDFSTIVANCDSYAEILRELGYLSQTGALYRCLKSRIEKENLNVEHINKTNKGRIFEKRRLTKEEFLEKLPFKNKIYRDDRAKLIKFEIIESSKCSLCGQGREWNQKPLVLQIDHINGINSDNRIENLRFLCPNCHSQTETFGTKNLKKAL